MRLTRWQLQVVYKALLAAERESSMLVEMTPEDDPEHAVRTRDLANLKSTTLVVAEQLTAMGLGGTSIREREDG